jgi:glycine betaine/choline ABC-type transport system substrate-binding protein
MNSVSAKLTNEALQGMNGAVDLQHQRAADVARRFLRATGLL